MKKIPPRNRRGATMVAFAIGLGAFLALAVVGIDLGRLAHVATETQSAADVAATAGTQALFDCASNKPCPGGNIAKAKSDGQVFAAQNQMNGSAASIAQPNIVPGCYDFTTHAFVASSGGTCSHPYAVQATANTTVNNLFAGVFGSSQATTAVTKISTAAVSGLGTGTPGIPLGMSECDFQSIQSCFGTSGCLPNVTAAPDDKDNLSWTGFFSGNSTKTIEDYIPAPCGGGNQIPTISVGQSVDRGDPTKGNNGNGNGNGNNGNNGNGNGNNGNGNGNKGSKAILQDIQCLIDNNTRQFLIPIYGSPCGSCPCGQTYQTSIPVVGFATIVLDSVNGSNVALHAIYRSVPGPGGGLTGSGTGSVSMVCESGRPGCS